ncbi:MAG: hypothetical protein JW864_08090 [Spirochaetes bacterium]|nr:hypothetical protein [Spirochaetota bacterium]
MNPENFNSFISALREHVTKNDFILIGFDLMKNINKRINIYNSN